MPLKCEMRMPIRILSRQHYEPLPPSPLLTTASFARLKFMRPVLSPHSNWVPKHLETKLIVLQGMAWSHQTLPGFKICVQLGQDTGTLLWLNVRSTFSPLSVSIGLVQKPFWSYLAQLIKCQCQWGNYRLDWFNGQIVIMWDHQSKLIKEILLCPGFVSN